MHTAFYHCASGQVVNTIEMRNTLNVLCELRDRAGGEGNHSLCHSLSQTIDYFYGYVHMLEANDDSPPRA